MRCGSRGRREAARAGIALCAARPRNESCQQTLEPNRAASGAPIIAQALRRTCRYDIIVVYP